MLGEIIVKSIIVNMSARGINLFSHIRTLVDFRLFIFLCFLVCGVGNISFHLFFQCFCDNSIAQIIVLERYGGPKKSL